LDLIIESYSKTLQNESSIISCFLIICPCYSFREQKLLNKKLIQMLLKNYRILQILIINSFFLFICVVTKFFLKDSISWQIVIFPLCLNIIVVLFGLLGHGLSTENQKLKKESDYPCFQK